MFEEKDTKRLVPLDQCLSFKIEERVFESGPEPVVYSLDRKEFSPSCIGKIDIKSFCNNITFKVVKINLFYKKNLIATHFISDLNNLNSEFYDDLKYSYYLQFVVNNGTEDIVFNKFFLGAIENINSSQLIDFR